MQRHHEGELNIIEAPENNHRISKCDVCSKLVNKKDLEKHMKVYHVKEWEWLHTHSETTDGPEDLGN